jgi:hypothetical protein
MQPRLTEGFLRMSEPRPLRRALLAVAATAVLGPLGECE